MPRLTAGALTPAHVDHLVTVSTETGESITFTLSRLDHGYTGTTPAVLLSGHALGNEMDVNLPHWHPVHVFTDDVSPTAKARVIIGVGAPIRNAAGNVVGHVE